MALTIGELVAYITADNRGFRRGVKQSKRDLDGFTRDANGRLHDVHGRFVAEGEAAGRGFSGGVLRGVRQVTRGLLKMSKIQFVKAAQVAVLATLAGGAAVAASNVLALVTALAPLAGLLAALPGAVALAQAGLITLKVALSGVGDAFKAALSGDAAKFAEALEKLSPAARAVAKEFRAVIPQLDAIKLVTQEAFFAPLRGEISATAKVLSGPLRASMSAVAAEFGKGTREIARFAREGRTVSTLQTIFGATRSSLANLTPAIRPLLGGLRDLAGVGATFTASLTPGIASAAARLGEFLSQAVASGRALQWMQNALIVLRQLATIAGNLGGILGSILKAAQAQGSGLLGVFGQLTGQLNTFLKSAEGASALRAIFGGISAIGRALAPVLGALVRGLGAVAPGVGRIAEAMGPVLTRAINVLAPALAQLEPGIIAVVNALGGVVDAIGPALLPLAKAISAELSALAPILPILAQALAQVGLALAQHVTTAIQAVAPYIPQLAQGFVDLVVALVPLIPAFTELVLAGIPLVPMIADIIKIAADLVAAVLPSLTTALGMAAGVMRFLAAVVGQVWPAIRGVITGAVTVIRVAISWMSRLPGLFAGWFGSAKTAAGRALSSLVTTVRGIPGKIRSALGGLGSLLWGSGSALINGLIRGIDSAVGALQSKLSWITGLIPSWKGPMSLDLRLLQPSGRALMSGLVSGITAGMPAVESTLARATQAIGAGIPAPATAAAPSGGAGSGGGGVLGTIVVDLQGGDGEILSWLRKQVKVEGGGNVQLALGKGP
ncbi:MAG: phage tail protein [Streptomyces sp.]